ncbi:MAG: hypothetical protein ACE5FO_00835 [Parvularculaceae bacterium]
MNDSRREPGAPYEADADRAADADIPLRFQGIVESGGERHVAGDGPNARRLSSRVAEFEARARRWNASSRQVWQASRLAAVFIFFAMVVGWPLGDFLAHLQTAETAEGWSPFSAFTTWTLMFAIIVPVLILICGYLLSRTMTMMNAAESIAAAARQFVQPDETAVYNAKVVGTAVRGQMDALNEGLDGALTRLASVEAMIRRHVEAIEVAGAAIETSATGAIDQVASERARLIKLTESLNTQADSFAAAIAAKAQASIEALQSAEGVSERAEAEFDDRLARLEAAAHRALESFEALRNTLCNADESMRASTGAIESSAEDTLKASEKALAAAETAARAAETARTTSHETIDAAVSETGKIADAAVETAAREAAKVSEATGKALDEIKRTSQTAVETASGDAAKATEAADRVNEAARKASEAAARASADIAKSSATTQQSAEEALSRSDSASRKFEERGAVIAEARAALEKENARLESLIEEQRKRADRLADAIAAQTGRMNELAESEAQEKEASAQPVAARNKEAQSSQPQPGGAKRQAPAQPDADAAKANAAPAPEKTGKSAPAKPETPHPAAGEKKSAGAKKPARRAPPKDGEVLDLTAAAERAAPKQNAPSGGDEAVRGVRAESARLEALAQDIAERRNGARARREPPVTAQNSGSKNSAGKTDDKRDKRKVTWREILDAAEDAEPLDLAAVSKPGASNASQPSEPSPEDEAANAIRIIGRLQIFTRDLETRLYGDPPPALVERFDMGDRNVFANRLLRLNETDVKRRIRTESGRDKDFERNIHDFLQGFEKLLEDATTSETADEDLEEYLSSPLGRVYLLIGATVGYFA